MLDKKKLLYIVRYPADEEFNLKGKFDGQIKAFQNLNFEVYYLTFDKEYFYLQHGMEKTKIGRATTRLPMYFHTKVYYDMHCAVLNAAEKISFDYVYWRGAPSWYSSYKAGKFLHKQGSKILYEIPTYCRDGEKPMNLLRRGFKVYSDIWYKKLMQYMDMIVMIFTEDAVLKEYYSRPVVVIDNGVDVDAIPLRNPDVKKDGVHILALASMSYWHGYDRLIRSLYEYKGEEPVTLHMVGGNDGGMLPEWKNLAKELGVEDRVIFHGKMYGEELSQMFDLCDVGTNALAQYTKNLHATSELKVREYTARGLPFLCSVEDPALNHAKEVFWMKVVNDDSVPDMQKIVDFALKMRADREHPVKMRAYAKEYMTWESQYAPIFKQLEEQLQK